MSVRQYIGARYVPKFYENSLGTSEWMSGVMYEPLTIVTYNGNSYTSKKAVPVGVGDPSMNPEYWVATGIYNQQIQEFAQRLTEISGELDENIAETKKANNTWNYYFPAYLDFQGHTSCLTFLAVGEKTILFDTGANRNLGAILAFYQTLYDNGTFTNIDMIVISHYHWDHTENLASILDAFPHENCVAYIPLSPSGYYTGTDVSAILEKYQFVVDTLTAKNIPYTIVSQDTYLEIGEGSVLSLYNSTPADYQYYNSNSPTIYNNFSMFGIMNHNGVSDIFPADVQNVAQQRIMSEHYIPNAQMYVAHHHGIQNDDYKPYLDAIFPEVIVIPTSCANIHVTGRGCMVGDYFPASTKVTTEAYGNVEVRSGSSGATLIKGKVIGSVGDTTNTINIYVDLDAGTCGDGSINSPVITLTDALNLCHDVYNVEYHIYVKNSVGSYAMPYIRNRKSWIVFHKWGDTNPRFRGAYIGPNCCITFDNITFIGAVAEGSNWVSVHVCKSKVRFTNCVFTIPTDFSSGSWMGLELEECESYINACTFNGDGTHTSYGVTAFFWGKIWTNGNTFNNISCAFYTSNLEVYIRGVDTCNTVTDYIRGGQANSVPFTVCNPNNASVIALLANNGQYSISHPFLVGSDLKIATGASVKTITTS